MSYWDDYKGECYVNLYGPGAGKGYFDYGTYAVIDFVHHIEKGHLKNAISIEREFNCNADVRIMGKDLIPLIEKYYPDYDRSGIVPSEEYSFFCYDMS